MKNVSLGSKTLPFDKALTHIKEYKIGYAVLSFWYLAQFPGRLGFDYSESIRLIRKGLSTDWWTGEFYWFLKITSFNGRTIALTSLICLIVLTHALQLFTRALIQDRQLQKKVFNVLSFSPIVGNFGVNVSHDIFLAAGIIILISLNINFNANSSASDNYFALLAKYIYPTSLLMTSQLGRLVIISLIFWLILKRFSTKILPLVLALVCLYSLTNFTVTRFDKSTVLLPIIFDLKCVAQHPEADINKFEWSVLEKLAPKEEWEIQTSCTLGDTQIHAMPSFKLRPSVDLLETYISVTAKNPAIVIMAHIQRSRGALPPPFFQGPDNQVPLDASIPIGFGTNTALQSGTELLHPSIDEPTVNNRIKYLKFLEPFAQIPIFLVNQASWFWGWGGLWLYPLFFVMYREFGRRCFKLLYPLLVLHLSLVAIGPGPFGRYVMATILLGQISTIILIMRSLSTPSRETEF